MFTGAARSPLLGRSIVVDVVVAFSRKDYWTAEQLKEQLQKRGLASALLDFVTGKRLDRESEHRKADKGSKGFQASRS